MKKLLLIVTLLAAVACTKDPLETPAGSGSDKGAVIIGSPEMAARGTIAVRLTAESAKTAVATLLVRSGAVSSGVAELDQIMADIDAQGFERIFAYDPAWEARYDQTGINCWYALYFDKSEDPARIARLLAACPGVRVVQLPVSPEMLRRMSRGPAQPLTPENMGETSLRSTRSTPPPTNDPYLGQQWHFENPGPGTGTASSRRAGSDINLYDAWQLCTGKENIVVAVIDEPIYTDHPDLKPNLWTKPGTTDEHGYNFRDKTAKLDWTSFTQEATGGQVNYYYADHGSHVAGVIAAVNNNGIGVGGIAGGGSKGNGVKLMSCQIIGYGSGKADPYCYVRAFEYALKNGAVIAQNSWGFDYSTTSEAEQIEQAWSGGMDARFEMLKSAMDTFIKFAGTDNSDSPIEGGLVTFAAGNNGDLFGDLETYPTSYQPLIAVGAMDWRFLPSWYTNFGRWIDITAPGGDNRAGGQVLSTILCDKSISYKDGRKTSDAMFGYGWMQGTSMACPHVSGVAALGLAYASQLGKRYTDEQYKALLLSSVYGIDPYFTGTVSGKVFPLSDYRGKMGGGGIDALKLLLAIRGTPALYVKTGSASTLDFAQFFGGADSKVTIQSAASSELAKLGLSSLPGMVGSKLTLTCPNTGTAFVTVKAVVGDTEISREFAIVSRPNFAQNGGWL